MASRCEMICTLTLWRNAWTSLEEKRRYLGLRSLVALYLGNSELQPCLEASEHAHMPPLLTDVHDGFVSIRNISSPFQMGFILQYRVGHFIEADVAEVWWLSVILWQAGRALHDACIVYTVIHPQTMGYLV